MIIQIIINIILSYLLGSISGSMVLGKLRGVDIRTMGSGNAGGTNAFRTIGPLFALGVVIIDILKGVVSVSLISGFNFHSNIDINLISYMPVLCGIAAVLGHVYPIYYNFKGGKGAGTLNRCDWYSISINYTICSFQLACSNCFNWFCWFGYNDFRVSNGSYNLFILSRWNCFTIWIFFYFNVFIFNFHSSI